ncbi:MAG: hypothetical protein CMJ94_14590 [Planctomycetes bacterium]|nr:hypothetical protein [Planctomycetota bacterium]
MRAAFPFFLPQALGLCLLAAAACHAPREQGAAPWNELPLLATHWESVSFGGEGEVEYEAAGPALTMRFGSPLTGVRWSGELPLSPHYEIEVRAARLDGSDFFCALNLPLGNSEVSVVLGGWGGALCGLSCVDGQDASMNASRSFRDFQPGRSYRLRVRVDGEAIRAWVDEEPLFEQLRDGVAFSLRTEVQPVGRLGISCFQTSARIEGVRWRPLP